MGEYSYITARESLDANGDIPSGYFSGVDALLRTEDDLLRTHRSDLNTILNFYPREQHDPALYLVFADGVYVNGVSSSSIARTVGSVRRMYPAAHILVHACGRSIDFDLADRLAPANGAELHDMEL